jgi:hypothetical protein
LKERNDSASRSPCKLDLNGGAFAKNAKKIKKKKKKTNFADETPKASSPKMNFSKISREEEEETDP